MTDADYKTKIFDDEWKIRLDKMSEEKNYGMWEDKNDCCEDKCGMKMKWENDEIKSDEGRHGRERFLLMIQCTEFSLIDTVLYLDTHPCDREALEYYHKLRCKLKELVREYSERFGPLTINDVLSDEYWTWVKTPWPWEEVC